MTATAARARQDHQSPRTRAWTGTDEVWQHYVTFGNAGGMSQICICRLHAVVGQIRLSLTSNRADEVKMLAWRSKPLASNFQPSSC